RNMPSDKRSASFFARDNTLVIPAGVKNTCWCLHSIFTINPSLQYARLRSKLWNSNISWHIWRDLIIRHVTLRYFCFIAITSRPLSLRGWLLKLLINQKGLHSNIRTKNKQDASKPNQQVAHYFLFGAIGFLLRFPDFSIFY